MRHLQSLQIRRKDCRSSRDDFGIPQHLWIEPKAFADLLTCDHKIVSEKDHSKQSRSGDRVALIIIDFFTKYLDAFPARSKDVDEVFDAFRRYLGIDCIPNKTQTLCVLGTTRMTQLAHWTSRHPKVPWW